MYSIHNIKKSLISGAIVASIALSSTSTISLAETLDIVNNGVSFTDVKNTDWFHDSVTEVAEMGLITGKGNGTFDPKGNLTLAEAISLASRARSNFEGTEIPNSQGEWYQGSVNFAKQNKIIGNNYEGRYNNPATRSEMAQIFASALPVSSYTQIKPVVVIPDVGTKDTNYIYIQQLYRAGILGGNDAYGTYNPQQTVSRAETATILQRILDPKVRESKSPQLKPVVQPQAPVVKPQAPVVTPQAPVVKPQAPVVTPQAPVVPPQAPVVTPQAPQSNGGTTVYAGQFRGQSSIQVVSNKPGTGLSQINTHYGRHTYGSTNQAEYDYVMEKIDRGYARAISEQGSFEVDINRYRNGDRDARLVNWMRNKMFYLDMSPETFNKVMIAQKTMDASGGTMATSTEKSLYNFLKNGKGDCNSIAYHVTASFDRAGFNTRIVHGPGHSWSEVQIDGKWHSYDGALSSSQKGSSGIQVAETFAK